MESSDSDSDFARVDLFKQQDFDQLGRRKLASAMNSARKGSKGLKQNIFDVNTEGDDKEDSKAKTPQKSLQKDAQLLLPAETKITDGIGTNAVNNSGNL